jgi:hypothetical protein
MKTHLKLVTGFLMTILFVSCLNNSKPKVLLTKMTKSFYSGSEVFLPSPNYPNLLVIEVGNISIKEIEKMKREDIYLQTGDVKLTFDRMVTMKGNKEYVYLFFSVPEGLKSCRLLLTGYAGIKVIPDKEIADKSVWRDVKQKFDSIEELKITYAPDK